MKKKFLDKKRIIVLGIIVLIIAGFFLIKRISNKPNVTGQSTGNSEQIKIYPLSKEEISTVGQTVLSSNFIKDMPKKGAIALQFYNFKDGKRIWQNGFLIGKNGFLNSGSPDLVLIIHSKYINELNNKDLCDVIHEAESNRDMAVETQESKAKLLMKYSGMLKYRECFGF